MRKLRILWLAVFAAACGSSPQSLTAAPDAGPDTMRDASPHDASMAHSDASQAFDSGSVRDAGAPVDAGTHDSGHPEDAKVADAAHAGTSDSGHAEDADGGMSDASMPVASEGLCANCPVGKKLCSGMCEASDDPKFGCGGSSCNACDVAHAAASCSGSTCAVRNCDPGWADCDHDVANGCEADLSSPATCGSCDVSCSGGTGLCSPQGCVSACTPPLTLCDTRCVNLSTSALNCGSCNHDCTDPAGSTVTAVPACEAGSCVTTSCRDGYALCDGSCTDLTRSSSSCGDCATHCDTNQECVDSHCVSIRCPLGMTYCGNNCSTHLSVSPVCCVATEFDSANCGACDHACGSNETCISGQCVDKESRWIAKGLSMPADLAIDDDQLYWTDIGDNTVKRVAIGGGQVDSIAHDQAKPIRPVVDDSYVYWSNNLGGAIMRAPKAGGSDPQIVTTAASPGTLVLDANDLYYTSNDTIQRVPKSGGTASAFATLTSMPPGIAVHLGELISDGTSLYVYYQSDGQYIWKVRLSDATATKLLYAGYSIDLPMKLDGTTLIFVAEPEDHVFSYAPTTAPPINTPIPYVDVTYTITAFVNNSCGVFWTDGSSLYLTRTNGVRWIWLASGAFRGLTLDSSHVYWSDGSGAIGRLPLPSK